jgi:hypothetical protein
MYNVLVVYSLAMFFRKEFNVFWRKLIANFAEDKDTGFLVAMCDNCIKQ